MGLGAFLTVFGSIGAALAWCFDISMLFGANTAVGAATTASTGNFFLLQFGIWIAYGFILWIGMALFIWSLVAKGYANDILLKVSATVSLISVVTFLNTLFNINFTSMASIMPMFGSLMIGTVLNTVWQVLVGKTMMED